jgi:excinuclease UvrABC nuclease subunit
MIKHNKGQLVCQHLENVSREALEKYQDIIKNYVRGRHGIYALFKKTRLYYVGLASNLRNRPKRCIKSEADMLKKPAKAIKFYRGMHLTPATTI